MAVLIVILLVAAAVLFLLAATNYIGNTVKVNIVAAGLLCWVVSEILARV
jgi:hypothetical protein